MPPIQNLLCTPFYLVYTLGFLYLLLGPYSLGGLAVMVINISITTTVSKYLKILQAKKSELADRRLEVVGEAVAGACIVKMYAWEDAFAAKIGKIRGMEINVLSKFAMLRMFVLALSTATPALTLLSMMSIRNGLVPVLTGKEATELSVADIFTSIALVNSLQGPLSGVAEGLASLAQASVALRRLSDFLRYRHSHHL